MTEQRELLKARRARFEEHVRGLFAPTGGLTAPPAQFRPPGEPGGAREMLRDGPPGLGSGKERLLEAGRAQRVAVDLGDRRREQAPSSPTGGALAAPRG